jgi:acetyltransferase-like isoleucine patch superfamily enzyme
MEKIESLEDRYWLLKTQVYYRRFFGSVGTGSKLLNPLRLKQVEHIFLGSGVTINKHAFLLTVALRDQPKPRLTIGYGCVIGHMNHITCVSAVTIEKRVLTADRVHISDNSHRFDDPTKPVVEQGVISKGPVRIGEGTWIGEGASVLSCSIGRNCVIGSNAVVVNDIPDYCVAVGAPARVVRQFNFESKKWDKVDARPGNLQEGNHPLQL